MVTLLSLADAVKFLRWGACGDILRVREAVPGRGNQARGWSIAPCSAHSYSAGLVTRGRPMACTDSFAARRT